MAIDTTNEKLALITYHQAWNTPLPISADGLDQADNQHLLWEYPGLLWEEIELAVGEVHIVFTAKQPDMTFDAKKPDMLFAVKQPGIVFTD